MILAVADWVPVAIIAAGFTVLALGFWSADR